ncbi:hypothetical protein NZD89_06435 [Alicyclobacillus fastidiosus]|uniref:Uncharacterized protein n=1 Tax=Alicyclobacillus fastidiosus TaxID=392011 RepID=A0ABY6ZJD7_9BACL|nr:hypothetical protein [Alicyclobacillus fastidiosus]WAH43043.1 hypothetical protein NZD89_06435 [Alicyclobacillus fastidiosus]GMA65023.1 hypothetical protein GCM10025859_54630 [Alicyclobacillus fastidiosus]
MTKLSEIHSEYEATMQADMSNQERDKALAGLMTRMKNELGLPSINNQEWEQENNPAIALYRTIFESRAMLLDKPNNKAELRIGSHVQVNDFADNFFRKIGKVKSIGEATCDVEIDGYSVEYLLKQLTPLD